MMMVTVTFGEERSHLEVAGCEPDDGGFVELAGDGGRQRQQPTELGELGVLLLSPRPRRRLGLLLHRSRAHRRSPPHVLQYSHPQHHLH